MIKDKKMIYKCYIKQKIMPMKTVKLSTTIMLLFAMSVANAQLSRTDADSIVLNTIVNDTTKIVYVYNNSLGQGGNIMTAEGVELANPYDNSYVYFIDDNPAANWAHSCQYIFINREDGLFTIVNEEMYPHNYTEYTCIVEQNFGSRTFWPYTDFIIPEKAEPNGKLYAVLIAGDPGVHPSIQQWYNLSCVYTALVNKYGFVEATNWGGKRNIFVITNNTVKDAIVGMYPDYDFYSHDLNQSHNYLFEDDFLDSGDFPFTRAGIKSVFDNLSGNSNTADSIPELTEQDQLFVYVCGHGNKSNDCSYLLLGNAQNERLYDYDLTKWVRDIKCSQMTFMIDCCYSGGFIDDIMNDNEAVCKNRAIHTSTDETHLSWVEQYITPQGAHNWERVSEFVYYWTASILGYYPILELHSDWLTGPWYQYDSTAIGRFQWNIFFNESVGQNHVAYDVNPDTDRDGKLSMNEIFIFADNLDSFSHSGYYNPPITPVYNSVSGQYDTCEYPSHSYESTFTKELITLGGYQGLINGDTENSAGHKYFLDGGVIIAANSSLSIQNNSIIAGGNNQLINKGVLTTASQVTNAKFKNVDIFNNSGELSLSHCVFDTCGTIRTKDGPFAIRSSTLNETCVDAYVVNVARDSYSVVLNQNVFNNTLANNTIKLKDISQCDVSGNYITSGSNGIEINGLSNLYTNHVFMNNHICDCVNGFVSYASNAKIKGNRITGNSTDGIKSLNGSGLHIIGDSTATLWSDVPKIANNGRYQVYATNNSCPAEFHHNWLQGNGTNNDYILFFESNNPQGTHPFVFNVANNCWYPLADSNIPSHLLSTGNSTFYYLPTWTPSGGLGTPENPSDRLNTGDSLAEDGDYDGARAVYMEIVSDYPESQEAVAALNALFSVEVESKGDFVDLRDYYLGLLSDDNLGDAADHYANKCDVEMGNYADAVEWYENKITDSNASYSERVFAEIDLGDLYLRMEDEGNKGIQGKLAEYIPASKEAHEKHADYLIALLPGNMDGNVTDNSSNIQMTCSPNPASDKMTLSYTLAKDAIVELSLRGVLGNEIRHIGLGRQNGGVSNSVEIDLSKLPSGVYFCSILIDENNRQTIKFVKN